MTVKDLHINDMLYGVYENGYTVLFNIIDIKVAINDYAYYVITLNQYNNGQKRTVQSHVHNSSINTSFNGHNITLYLSKNDAIEELNAIIEDCKEGLDLIK